MTLNVNKAYYLVFENAWFDLREIVMHPLPQEHDPETGYLIYLCAMICLIEE